MNEEINSLLKNETWELVALPEGRKAIENKWVFRVKRDKNGIEIKKKSRLVIKGFRQKYGIDYKETFAPVVQMQSLRLLLALSVINNWKSFQVDVKTAFLYGTLEEDIYMKQPKGFIKEGQEHLVCKLKKSLYGLKQAPRVWHEEIKGTLISIGFKQCTCDNGIFVISDKDRYMVLAMWVDDMPIFYENESDRKWLMEQIRSKYEIEESELEYILGIKIEKEKGRLKINQTAYIEKKVEEYGLADSKETTTPMIAKQNLEDSEHEKDDSPYRELIGSIMHSMVYTRPDISYAVSILSRSLGTSTKGHFEAAKRVLKYLKTTKNLAIEYSRPISNQSELEVYVDSADAAYPHFGYVIKLAGGAISWKSTKSKLSTLSSTESEYIALSSVTQEVMWIRELLAELGFEQQSATKIFEDNQSTIAIANDPVQQGRTKHLGRRLAFVRDAINNEQVYLEYCPAENMVADMLTKVVHEPKLRKFRSEMGLTSLEVGVSRIKHDQDYVR